MTSKAPGLTCFVFFPPVAPDCLSRSHVNVFRLKAQITEPRLARTHFHISFPLPPPRSCLLFRTASLHPSPPPAPVTFTAPSLSANATTRISPHELLRWNRTLLCCPTNHRPPLLLFSIDGFLSFSLWLEIRSHGNPSTPPLPRTHTPFFPLFMS